MAAKARMRDRALVFLMFIAIIAVADFGYSWLSWHVSWLPRVPFNFVTASQPTVMIPLSDSDFRAGAIPTAEVDSACQDVPFYLLPIAEPSPTVKAILVYGSRQLGEIVVRCSDHGIVSQREYTGQ